LSWNVRILIYFIYPGSANSNGTKYQPVNFNQDHLTS
jgi:hypothetical protein